MATVDRQQAFKPVRLAIYAGPGTRKGMHHLVGEMKGLPGTMVLPVGPEEIRGAFKDLIGKLELFVAYSDPRRNGRLDFGFFQLLKFAACGPQ